MFGFPGLKTQRSAKEPVATTSKVVYVANLPYDTRFVTSFFFKLGPAWAPFLFIGHRLIFHVNSR